MSWTYSHCHCVTHAITLVGWLKHVKPGSLSLCVLYWLCTSHFGKGCLGYCLQLHSCQVCSFLSAARFLAWHLQSNCHCMLAAAAEPISEPACMVASKPSCERSGTVFDQSVNRLKPTVCQFARIHWDLHFREGPLLQVHHMFCHRVRHCDCYHKGSARCRG